ncbi:hypothetical protein AN640_00955 [Candidatus Epulonipiscium fishelsonii]|uniref:Uncharacterized protein n=1 Tax=Candidatus Epulonipiscium fishelsonii TaxID=77094 RepID=A0ACC8XJ05_9FIRM|nr:hypothetical protein AN640_00955 [Epulopiscium sp. SCG-D08WGA-EpuloA1]OON98241.1 MAG: hypothetical protein ATN32_04750 [Epulopiscium sp. AS2M-Bin002]
MSMQWFKIPKKIFFQPGSIQYLSKLENANKVLIITKEENFDMVETLIYQLNKNKNSAKMQVEIFTEVHSICAVSVVQKGIELMSSFKPDTIIALGADGTMSAAKAMWLFYEQPELNFDDLSIQYKANNDEPIEFDKTSRKSQLITIPTTSSGFELTPFSIVQEDGTKFSINTYQLTPDIVILDMDFSVHTSPQYTASFGLKALGNAVEAYISELASDYTDGLAIKAIDLIFKYLPRAYKDGNDLEARERMHNAAAISGMAFGNTILNNEKESDDGRVARKYTELSKYLGLPASTPEEGFASFNKAIQGLVIQLQ